MNLKRLFGIILLGLLSIQFNITSCSSGTDADDDGSKASVKDPTNEYQAVVEVVSFGGVSGCSIAAVVLNNESVIDAVIHLNDVTLTNDTNNFLAGLYSDSLFELSYESGTDYTLEIFHLGKKIASGKAKMPSTPKFTNLDNIRHHNLNENMTVTWEKIENATSLELTIKGEVYDPAQDDYSSREYSTELLSPTSTSFTIPDTFFSIPGEYTLGLVAYYGVNSGAKTNITDGSSPYTKSYNMDGAAGVFLAANLSSYEGESIIVGAPSTIMKNSKAAKNRPMFKDILIKQHKKYFKTK